MAGLKASNGLLTQRIPIHAMTSTHVIMIQRLTSKTHVFFFTKNSLTIIKVICSILRLYAYAAAIFQAIFLKTSLTFNIELTTRLLVKIRLRAGSEELSFSMRIVMVHRLKSQ